MCGCDSFFFYFFCLFNFRNIIFTGFFAFVCMQNKTHARFRPSSNDSQVCLILIVNYFFVIKLLNNFYTKNCDADASCVLLKLSSSNLCPIFIWFAASFVFSNKLLCWIFGFNVFFFKLSVILLSHSVAIAIISFVCYLLFFFFFWFDECVVFSQCFTTASFHLGEVHSIAEYLQLTYRKWPVLSKQKTNQNRFQSPKV